MTLGEGRQDTEREGHRGAMRKTGTMETGTMESGTMETGTRHRDDSREETRRALKVSQIPDFKSGLKNDCGMKRKKK